jgi:hypothetical protein
MKDVSQGGPPELVWALRRRENSAVPVGNRTPSLRMSCQSPVSVTSEAEKKWIKTYSAGGMAVCTYCTPPLSLCHVYCSVLIQRTMVTVHRGGNCLKLPVYRVILCLVTFLHRALSFICFEAPSGRSYIQTTQQVILTVQHTPRQRMVGIFKIQFNPINHSGYYIHHLL